MAEIYRKIDVHFSRDEIMQILTERAKRMVRPEFGNADDDRCCHVEGEAIVTLTIWPPEVRKRMNSEAKARDANRSLHE